MIKKLKIQNQKSRVGGQAPHPWKVVPPTSFWGTLMSVFADSHFRETKMVSEQAVIQKRNLPKVSGQVMLIVILLLGGSAVAASTIAGYLILLSIRQSSDIANSAKAIYAADSGIEWDLYERFKDTDRSYPQPAMTNNSSFKVTEKGSTTRAIGKASQSYRALQVNL